MFESDAEILLVECKAKALTRGAMAGVHGDALLDFAGGMFAAQTRALRHERILRSVGHIEFIDGSRLEMRGRRITRLSVTLLDHGALQDKMTLANMFGAMLGASFKTTPGYPKSGQVDKLNRTLNDLRNMLAGCLEVTNENGPRLWWARAGSMGRHGAGLGLAIWKPRAAVPSATTYCAAPSLVAEGGRLHLLDSITIAGVINAD